MIEELSSTPFRRFRVAVRADRNTDAPFTSLRSLVVQLGAYSPDASAEALRLAALPADALVDHIAGRVLDTPEERLEYVAQDDVEARARLIEGRLADLVGTSGRPVAEACSRGPSSSSIAAVEGSVPEYTVASSVGTLEVEAENWMIALGQALPKLGVDLSHAYRWSFNPSTAGSVAVEERQSGSRFFIKPKVVVKMVVARGAVEDASLPPEDDAPRPPAEDEPMSDAPPPMLTMPLTSSLAPPPPPPGSVVRRKTMETESIAERLFDLSMDISGETSEVASQKALDLLQDLMPSEASSVARGSPADFHLTIVAATGPVADQIQGRIVPFGEGYVGLCFDARVAIQVNDVGGDTRHHVNLDERTGFVTRGAMCVPILRGDEIFGVIQVLNPENPFIAEDIEVAAQVAQVLAERLSSTSDITSI